MGRSLALVIEAVVERHFADAAVLWGHRDIDVHGTQRTVDELAAIDERLEAHLDGLRIAINDGWDETRLEPNPIDPGEAFVRTVLTLETHSPVQFTPPFTAARSDRAISRGVVSAFGWSPPQILRGVVRELLVSTDLFTRHIGIAACAVHRVDAGDALTRAVESDDDPYRWRALRAVGELGRADLIGPLRGALRGEDGESRLWAAWSAVRLGDRDDALSALLELGLVSPAARRRAIPLVVRVLSPSRAQRWLAKLRDGSDTEREVIIGAGMTGDPIYVPWLIDKMDSVNLARPAGDAFSLITGIDLYLQQMTRESPPDLQLGPSDNPDETEVAMDPDREMMWPDRQSVSDWWDANGPRFQKGERYLAGKPIDAAHCRDLLTWARQGVRQAAALELAIIEPESPLAETRASLARKPVMAGSLSSLNG